jgi:hypothetical protein
MEINQNSKKHDFCVTWNDMISALNGNKSKLKKNMISALNGMT